MRRTLEQRIMAKVRIDMSGCWMWTGAMTSSGYGQVSRDGRLQVVHRALYEVTVGAVTPGLDLDHLCRNRACVNPAHLEPVTRAQNLRRGVIHKSTLTHCPAGHPYSGENLFVSAEGWRGCRACRARQRRERCTSRKLEISETAMRP